MILTKEKIDKIDVDSVVNERIKNGRISEILFIVPTRRKIRYLTRELISISLNKSAAGLNIETMGSFAQKMLSNSFGEENLISEEASVLLLNQCFKETKLKYFSQYRTQIPFGTLERINNVISEYKRHGISPIRLRKEAENLSSAEKIKALDIANVYEKYQNRLNKIKLSEIGDVYSNLNQLEPGKFDKIFNEKYSDVNLVIINGFDEFSSPETNIINAAADIEQMKLFIILDYFKYNPLIFSHLDACHDRFVQKGFKEIIDLSPALYSRFIDSVKEYFSLKLPNEKLKSFSDNLALLAARNREEEVELVAKQIKTLLYYKKIEPNRICVVFNLIEKYSPVIRDRFPLFGIPFNLTDRFTLSTSEPVKGIIHLLEIVENDFYYKNILRALSNYFIKIEGIDLANLLRVSVELKTVSGYSNWIHRIKEARKELTTGYEENYNNRERIENYKQAENDLKKINTFLQPFFHKLNPAEFSQNVLSLIFQLNFPVRILKAPAEVVEKDLKALNTFINSLIELTGILELEHGKDLKFDLKYYLNQLRTLAAFSRYNVAEKPGYGVQVTTLNEIRGLKFDYIFICGLNDGDLPTRFSPEVFFSGSFARKENRHQIEQRYLFYQALCAWDKGLFLSYPLFDEKKELVPSSFLQDFLNLFSVQHKNHESYSDALFSKEELLEHLGKLHPKKQALLKFSDELKINLEKINNSIRIDSKRQTDPFGNFEYSGIIGENLPDYLKERLEEISNKKFSATQLETYAKCPYKFFLENVLKIQTVEEPLEELEAFEFGSLIHAILYEFYTSLLKKELILKKCSEGDFKKAEKILFDLAHKKFEELNLSSEHSFYEREKLLGIDGNRKNSLLYKFLEEERNNEDGYIPSFFELSFGKIRDSFDKNVVADKKISAGKVKLKGKIDRIDINKANSTLKVLDYKLSGTVPTMEDLKSGLSIQLPLYLFAAKHLLSAHFSEDYHSTGAEIFSLKYSEKDFGRNEVRIKRKVKNESLESRIQLTDEMIRICIEMINKHVKAISEGRFNLSVLSDKESKVCRFCDFKKICRIQENNKKKLVSMIRPAF
jgi:ATP-dependent helicase/nuclease subunit B